MSSQLHNPSAEARFNNPLACCFSRHVTPLPAPHTPSRPEPFFPPRARRRRSTCELAPPPRPRRRPSGQAHSQISALPIPPFSLTLNPCKSTNAHTCERSDSIREDVDHMGEACGGGVWGRCGGEACGEGAWGRRVGARALAGHLKNQRSQSLRPEPSGMHL